MMNRRIFLIPVYNEEGNLSDVLRDFEKELRQGDRVIFVDDGSQDNSRNILKSFSFPGVKVCIISHRRNRGLSRAILNGLAHIQRLMEAGHIHRDDIVVNFDADGQHDISCLHSLSRIYEKTRVEAVFPRRDFSTYPPVKILGNRLMTAICSLICCKKLGDAETGFRSFRVWVTPLFTRHIVPLRYSCAQQMITLSVCAGLKFTDKFVVRVNYYRSNTRLVDAVINPAIAILAKIRLLSGSL